VRVEIDTNADAIARRLERYPAALHRGIQLGIYDIADEVFAMSQRPWPPGVPVDKGTLKKSGNIRRGELEAIVGYNTPYAAAVHYGIRDQDVRVRAHDRLTRAGKMVEVRSHTRHIRARKGRPYLTGPVELVMPSMADLMAARLREAWETIGGST
jgi:hypothetical protein